MDDNILSGISGLSDAAPPPSAEGAEAPPVSIARPAPGPTAMAASPTAAAAGNIPGQQPADVQPPAASTPAVQPGTPHAGLRNMLQSLFLGMDAFGKSIATGGREGGVGEVIQARQEERKMKLEEAASTRAGALADAQLKHTQALTNATIAQTEINKMNAPVEHQNMVIGNQKALYDLYVNVLHVNPLFAVPIVQGQTTDAHMNAIDQKAGGDLVGHTVIPVHDDTVGGNGTSYGFGYDQLRKVNIPIELAAGVITNLQNQINLAKGVLPDGEKDPAIQAAQGKLDVMKKGSAVNGYDFFVFDNQVQSQILSRVNNQQTMAKFQEEQAKAKSAAQAADPLFKMENEPGEMAAEKSSAAIALLQNKITDPSTTPQDKVRSARLLSQAVTAHALHQQDQIQKANADQAAKQGDPKAAGRLLNTGDVTIADLKTRGMTTKWLMDAIAAAKAENPKYNPADELIAENVAKSPAQNTFFASANSLIAKHGTLDQLQANYNKLPNGQFPAFNKMADYTSYAEGHPEMAGFMQTAIGAADDYAKVMGGGQGSDSARLEILHSFAASHSPEQMKAAIDSARMAVGSQVKERIGTNKFLDRQYGYGLDNVPGEFRGKAAAPAPAGATMKVPGSDGQLHWSDGKQDLGVVQ